MLTKVKTVALDGMKGELVEIETDISNGLPYFSIIGMADTSVREATERVKRALVNSGFDYPKGRITVNLSPAHIHKRGSHFDLGIAIGLLLSQNIISNSVENILFMGELSLDGRIVPIKGALPMIMSIIENNDIEEIILPKENCSESYLFTKNTNVKIFPATSLKEVVSHLDGKRIRAYEEQEYNREDKFNLDFLDVLGHENVKEAVMIAVAGKHNLLMIGPPGTGKTMIAKRVTSILKPMTLAEQIETTRIYSYAGKLTKENPIISERPFRHITLGTTQAALVGGGTYPMPGEVSLAHNGVLFIDEMLEFPDKILENLRVPMEDKKVHIVRKGNSTVFQSNFLLIGATNPCRCGFYGDARRPCTCTQTEINQYRSKLSGALMDRIDMTIEVSAIDYKEIEGNMNFEYSSEKMLETILKATKVQEDRYYDLSFDYNGDIESKYIETFCKLDKTGKAFMESIYENKHISMRRYHKILKVARTIADIKQKKNISIEDLSASYHYTRFFSERSGN